MERDAAARWAILAAACTWCGAWVSVAVPLWVTAAGVALAWRTRGRPLVACVAIGLLASALGARSLDGLAPLERRDHVGEVTLVSDPERLGPSVRVDVRISGKRVEAWARGAAAARLAPRLAGERVELSGRLGPPPDDAPWLQIRHVVGRLGVDEVGDWRQGHPASQLANGLRRTLSRGAAPLDDDDRTLFLGLVLGDDRGQDPLVVDAFAGSGLGHLLAVSGSNVAFVMAVAGPALVRLRLGRRLVATLAVLAFFALVTRFEPSVLRATTMAGLSAAAVTFGWASESRRILPATVVVLLLVDPLLARSLGFQLSVAASMGIVWWSARLSDAIPGPRALVHPLGVTLAAQVAVAPLLVPVFGSMPVAAVPANLLAGPAAGYVVVWGLPAGLLAGVLGPPFEGLLHLPTELLVSWIAGVAAWCAGLPLGELRSGHLVALAAVGLLVAVARASPRRRLVAVSAVLAVVVHPAWASQSTEGGPVALGPGAVLHRKGGSVVVEIDGEVHLRALLEGLRRAGIDRIDVVVAHDGGADVAEAVAVLRERSSPRLVLAPDGHRVPGGSVPPPGARIGVGPLTIEVEEVSPRLVVTVRSGPDAAAGGRRARAPPRTRSSPPR